MFKYPCSLERSNNSNEIYMEYHFKCLSLFLNTSRTRDHLLLHTPIAFSRLRSFQSVGFVKCFLFSLKYCFIYITQRLFNLHLYTRLINLYNLFYYVALIMIFQNFLILCPQYWDVLKENIFYYLIIVNSSSQHISENFLGNCNYSWEDYKHNQCVLPVECRSVYFNCEWGWIQDCFFKDNKCCLSIFWWILSLYTIIFSLWVRKVFVCVFNKDWTIDFLYYRCRTFDRNLVDCRISLGCQNLSNYSYSDYLNIDNPWEVEKRNDKHYYLWNIVHYNVDNNLCDYSNK